MSKIKQEICAILAFRNGFCISGCAILECFAKYYFKLQEMFEMHLEVSLESIRSNTFAVFFRGNHCHFC